MASPQGGTGLPSVITGLLVAVAAVVPLVWFTSSQAAETATEQPAEAPPTTVAAATTAPEPVVEIVVVTPDPVVVDGLPESVVRTLESAGNVREEAPSELGLPQSVVNVLVGHDVVLRVAEEPAP